MGGAGSSWFVQPGGNVRLGEGEGRLWWWGHRHNPSTTLIHEISLEREFSSVLPFQAAGPLGWEFILSFPAWGGRMILLFSSEIQGSQMGFLTWKRCCSLPHFATEIQPGEGCKPRRIWARVKQGRNKRSQPILVHPCAFGLGGSEPCLVVQPSPVLLAVKKCFFLQSKPLLTG